MSKVPIAKKPVRAPEKAPETKRETVSMVESVAPSGSTAGEKIASIRKKFKNTKKKWIEKNPRGV